MAHKPQSQRIQLQGPPNPCRGMTAEYSVPHSNRRRTALLLALSAFESVLAHDQPRPEDPSMQFERMIVEGLANIERQRGTAILMQETVEAARSIFNVASIWTSKSTLSVCFWNGDSNTRALVEQAGSKWNGASRISLSFRNKSGVFKTCSNRDDSDIRVSLDGSDPNVAYELGQDRYGNWSLIGRQSTFVPANRPLGTRYEVTMNIAFAVISARIGDIAGLNFTVSHEFGHALGLLHEFQAATCKDWIDIKSLARDQGWNSTDAALNLYPLPDVPARYKQDFGAVGAYDVLSVMQYNFAQKYYVVVPGKANPCLRTEDVVFPSKQDLATIAGIYGLPDTPEATSTGERLRRSANAVLEQLPQALQFARTTNQWDASALTSVEQSIRLLQEFEKGRHPR